MGASFNSVVLTGTKAEVTVKWRGEVEQARYENGNGGYSGSFAEMGDGIDFHDTVMFETQNKAEEYISDKHSKWDGPIAVRFKSGKETESSKKRQQAMQTKRVELSKSADNILQIGFAKLKTCKAPNLSCKECKSKMNKKFIHNHQCPLCGKSLLSNTIMTRYNKAQDKYKALKLEHENYIPQVTKAERKSVV